ncbi:hypothetical protein [Brevibacterium aurantiacum]|uniref:Uncharacterized protein n=1 Tax=Brevibacterium aurantiacum TaxID=273384 RepID=A0A1D7W7Y3_BREAU|nr:hypothetical protein [Brevibacterium aurantiacum]AOP55147.1 hypothetical protein BLSMQ_3447 [Brevibacterium aurantiacum]RCS95437.1 hypothetical protein CIK60_16345 [Brevibacterium aurantiacum]
MKKLVLAPAVALAITGLAASPVMAAPETPAQTQPTSQTGALQKAKVSGTTSAGAQAGTIGVSADSVTVEEFAENGVGIAGEGLTPDTEYALAVTPADGQAVNPYETTVTTDASGAFETAVEGVGEPNPAFVGSYTVTVTNPEDAEDSATTTFKVTGDAEEPEAPAVDPKVSLNTEKISASDFEKDGLKVTGEGFTPDSAVTVLGNATQSPFFQEEVKADEDGKISTTVEAPEDGLEPGDYSVSAVDAESEEVSNSAKFTVTADETEEPKPTTPAAEATLKVSPETIEAADFVVENKGVTLAVENCEPGSDVHYLVTPKGNSNVTAYDNTVKADDEGNASVNVYGTSANDPSAYLGDYDVTVTCGDDELTGAFTVSDDANAGGSDGNEDGNEDGNADGGNGGDDDGNGNGGGDLPRTGTELTGLVGGAALLLIGGAAVTMTMRRKKAVEDPSAI